MVPEPKSKIPQAGEANAMRQCCRWWRNDNISNVAFEQCNHVLLRQCATRKYSNSIITNFGYTNIKLSFCAANSF